MEVTTQTRLQVNSYTAHNVKNKGMIGYQHIKRMLEYMLEDYKEKHYIRSISLNKLRIEYWTDRQTKGHMELIRDAKK